MAEIVVKNTFLEIVDRQAATHSLPRMNSLPSLKIMEADEEEHQMNPKDVAKTTTETPCTMSLASLPSSSVSDADSNDDDDCDSSTPDRTTPPSPICHVVKQLQQPQHCVIPPPMPHVGADFGSRGGPPSGENVLSKLLMVMGQTRAEGERRHAAAASGFFSMLLSGLCASLSSVPGVKVLLPLEEPRREAVLEVQKIQDGGSVMTVMAVAQTCLIESCSKMKEVHLLGHRTGNIFKPSTQGFEAHVAYVPPEDEAKACWDLYQKGFCPRSGRCRWRHSDDILTFKVVMAK